MLFKKQNLCCFYNLAYFSLCLWNLISSWPQAATMFSNYTHRYTLDFILQKSKGWGEESLSILCDKTMCNNRKLPNSYSKPEQTPGNTVKSAKFVHCVLPPPFSMPFFLLAPSALLLCPSAPQNSKHYLKKNLALPKGTPKATSMPKCDGAPYGHKYKESAWIFIMKCHLHLC